MEISFKEAAYPVMWLLKGTVEHDGKTYPFWYQYDERDGEILYEFADGQPDDDALDFWEFQQTCQAQLEKSWPIVHHLPKVS